MKFLIEKLTEKSGRLGQLMHQKTGEQFKTPMLIQVTKGGSIPFLSQDVFQNFSPESQLLQMSLATMDHMVTSISHFIAGGLSEFVGFKGYPTLLTIRDPCQLMPSGFNDKDIVPLFTRRGKESLSATDFIKLVETFKPDIYQGLCDADTKWDSAKKRIQKSVNRTETFMDYVYERHSNSDLLKKSCLFAPIVGGYNTYNRSQSIKHAKEKGASHVGGFIFEGFHNYGLTATEVECEQIMPIMKHCLKELDNDKPIMMPGAFTPIVMLKLIQLGVDMFDSSYAYYATINYKALSFDFNVSLGTERSIAETPFIDVTDKSFRENFSPLVKDCPCSSCTDTTRSYIHHLYKTSELLGFVLLMIHNSYHLMRFFSTIRDCISKDNLNDLIQLIEMQGGDKSIDYRIESNIKADLKTTLTKDFYEEQHWQT